MWPGCHAPMVGTSPIVEPSRRRRRRREGSSIAPGVSKIAGALAGAVFDLFSLWLGRRRGAVGGIPVLGSWEGSAAHLLGELLGSLGDLLRKIGVALHKLWSLARGQTEHVVEDKHLPVRAGAGSNPDGWDANGFC